jgi:hypothetical protein
MMADFYYRRNVTIERTVACAEMAFECLYSKQFDARDKNKDGVVAMDEMVGTSIIVG